MPKVCESHLSEFTKVYDKIDVVDKKVNDLTICLTKKLSKKVSYTVAWVVLLTILGVIVKVKKSVEFGIIYLK